jgi:hypothetical protein
LKLDVVNLSAGAMAKEECQTSFIGLAVPIRQDDIARTGEGIEPRQPPIQRGAVPEGKKLFYDGQDQPAR